MLRYLDRTDPEAPVGHVDLDAVYQPLRLAPSAFLPDARPYTLVNMAATVDGKAVIGGPRTTRLIGGPCDRALVWQIVAGVDAVLFGAGVLRSDDPPYPRRTEDDRRRRAAAGLRPDPLWVVVSGGGDVPPDARAFRGGPLNTALFTTARLDRRRGAVLERTTRVVRLGDETVDLLVMGEVLRRDYGVRLMNGLGGPTLNAALLAAGAADELFVTIAPKLQGGSGVPTLLEGASYPPDRLPILELVSLYADGSELFLRYRLPSSAPTPATTVDRGGPAAEPA
ncbi:MAG: RibD family protein [Chloroflexi bacterium]|nr:RibD family protein [Chloroflexota bacterium]